MNVDAPDLASQPLQNGPRPVLERAVSFLNTTGLINGRPFEDLPTAAAAIEWLANGGFLDGEAAAAEGRRFEAAADGGRPDLRRVHAARAGLRELTDALAEDRAPRAFALDGVNAVLRGRETTQLVRAGTHLRLAHRREGTPVDQALAMIARAIAEEMSEGRPERFRICKNDRCRWAFYDRSRPGTRRWCEMASCGNRMKAARHRARHRAGSATAGS